MKNVLAIAGSLLVLPAPAVFVREAALAFDEEGGLIDAQIRMQLDTLLNAFSLWMETVSKGVAHV